MNAALLKGAIVSNGKSQREVAKAIGMSPKTFYLHMKDGKFGLDDVNRMIVLLNISNPAEIFLSK